MMLNKGFSLVELMVVIAILGILYAVALPAYNDFIQDGRRADVQQTLLQQVAVLERIYTRSGGYPGSKPSSIVDTEFYTFSYIASDASSTTASDATMFELTATPVATSSQADDPCGALSIDYQSTKLPDQTGCWGS